jgi:hypothetical protein
VFRPQPLFNKKVVSFIHLSRTDVACKIAELVSQRRADAAATVTAALAHLPFRIADLTPESSPCACAHWRMPAISLAPPPCIRHLAEDQPDRVVVFTAENGVAVSGAVFLPSPTAKSSSSLPPPSSGGVIRLQPFPPFDMLLPQSIYNSKGTGVLPHLHHVYCLIARLPPAILMPAHVVAERVASSLVYTAF